SFARCRAVDERNCIGVFPQSWQRPTKTSIASVLHDTAMTELAIHTIGLYRPCKPESSGSRNSPLAGVPPLEIQIQ
ncbi:MAG: hypothetical protein RSD57_00745, partial [Comamonas sp.]